MSHSTGKTFNSRASAFLSRGKEDGDHSAHSADSQALSDDRTPVAPRRTQNVRASYFNKSTSSHNHANHNGAEEEEENKKHILANRYKTKLCKNYVATGSCPYESRCMFAHGDEELRTAEQNLADGLTSEEAIKAFQHPNRRYHNSTGASSSSYSAPNHRRSNMNNSNGARAAKRSDAAIVEAIPAAGASTSASMKPSRTAEAQAAATEEGVPAPAAAMPNEEAYYTENTDSRLPLNTHHVAYRYFYAHNPYALDLIAPEDRFYTCPPGAYHSDDYMGYAAATEEETNAGAMDMQQQEEDLNAYYYGDASANDYFPAEDMLEEEASYAYSNHMNGCASMTGGVAPGCACAAAELEDSTTRAREMILEP